ncbi:hypothetical protein IWQ60_002075 [Tieghemiomyces parasiticus]|uniref:Uncharacterized protein n=1 Tax=Tieghemiomyces parasiticus TaxID=78921 RepID=A0A9W8E1C4_9FUNG|nr:hypothetical protein IWQ60_002075 [Tieghemiomyces parasiticus]
MTDPADQQELLRRRREARQRKIKARGTDRLSQIKHTFTTTGDATEVPAASSWPNSSDQVLEGVEPAATPVPAAAPPLSSSDPTVPPPTPRRVATTAGLSTPRSEFRNATRVATAPSVPAPRLRSTFQVTPRPLLQYLGALLPILVLFGYALFVEWSNDRVLDYWNTRSKLAALLVEPPSQVLGDWHHAVPLVWYALGLQVAWLVGASALPSGATALRTGWQPLLPSGLPVELFPPTIRPWALPLTRLRVPTLPLGGLVDTVCWILLLTGLASVSATLAWV